ncbi:Ig-like domain-containing protein [Kribbella pratensis]|uniref:Ig-like domain-containing protein n=1 Tax=Kribbella pratensis TaxID=2512112 RepID=A0A4R8C4B3_9ACTN|nr:Ig-like domain-containing protein [Kribbella pratensis]
MPAALIAGSVVVVTGSSGTAALSAEQGPYRPPFAAGKHKAEFEPNTVLVKFKPKASSSARKAAVSKYGATAEDSVASKVVKLKSDVPAPDLLKKVKADPAVELASLNYKRYISAVPNDEYYTTDQKTYLNTVRMPQAWDVSKSSGSQIVAVLDTGVDAGHPDLVGHLVPGYNAVSSTRPNPVDDNGHGTMTLGIIAAAANNGVGVAGVGWNVKAMPVKVLDANGSGYDEDIAEGIYWAVDHGAKVINMSLGGPDDNPILHQAISDAVNDGVTVVAAAGNDGSDDLQYPASYTEVIAVAATDASGSLTDFSSFGNWVDIAAPGVDILSTGPRNLTPSGYEPYWYCTGTSCSAPIVTGVAALVKNKWPALTPAQVAQRVENLARDAGPRGIDPYYGHGIVDAYAALGGKWAQDFPVNAPDGNDQPARATAISLGSVSGTINTEGETDWYKVTSDAARILTFSVTGPEFNQDKYTANFGPRLLVFNSNLSAVAGDVKAYPDFYPNTNRPIWGPLTVSVGAAVQAGDTYIAVRNDNGSRDTRSYTLTVSEVTGRSSGVLYAYPVRDVSPADLGVGAPLTSTPTVTFASDMDPARITSDTVFLQNGKTGAVVPGTVAYDAAARTSTITPNAPLTEATPYRITVTLGAFAPNSRDSGWSSVFSTVDLTPQALTVFSGSGAYLAANLSWTIPATPDLDQVIVRRNVGSKAPTPTTGTLVYAGTGTSVKNTGLAQSTTYTYAAWVVDRTGHYSPIAVKQLLGMKSGIAVTSTLINYGGAITIKGSTLRIDNLAYAGLPVNVYVRPKTSSKFTLLAALKTSSTGTLSVTHKPLVSSVYMLTFPGSESLMGTRTADVTVQVRPTISAALSPASIRLGGTTAFSGYVLPAHYGQTVYLQQYGSKVWKSIASVKLSTSGKYAFGIKPAVRGQIAYRVYFPGDADHAPAYTVNKIVTIS